jgi:hypothetical protein
LASRIYLLARELNLDSKVLRNLCPEAGVTGKRSALATLTDEEVEKIRAYLKRGRVASQRIAELIEELRVTGYHGHDPAVANAPRRMGLRVTAARQLEAVASQVASAWLDSDLDDRELWRFIRTSLVDKIAVLAEIVESTMPNATDDSPQRNPSDWNWLCRPLWNGVMRLTTRAEAGLEDIDCGGWVVCLLLNAMALRQCAEHCLSPNQVSATFECSSTNIAPEFFDRCIHTLSWHSKSSSCSISRSTLNAVELSELTQLTERLSLNSLVSGSPRVQQSMPAPKHAKERST